MAKNTGLYSPQFEHDSCGIGFVANIKGSKSHQNISDALTILENMEHRGATGSEKNSGDGAGIFIQIPHEFFFDECVKLGVHLPDFGKYGVGAVFFPKEDKLREQAASPIISTWLVCCSLITSSSLLAEHSSIMPYSDVEMCKG